MKRRSRLRPPRSLRATRAGWCFIAIVFGVGFAALNTGNNLLYLVLAMMLAFLVLSGLLSETSLRGIRVERRLPRDCHARMPNRVVLRVHNALKKAPSFAISLDDLIETEAGYASAGRCFALRVGPKESLDRRYVFEPERRGDVHFDRVRVSTRFPFGLFVKAVELDLPETKLVYPAIDRGAGAHHDVVSTLEPDDRAGAAPSGDDVAGLREFVAGDSLGRIHWRRSARSGRLLVGEREGEAAGEVEVLLRLDRRAPSDVHEERIALAASEVVTHLAAGLRVGLRGPQLRVPPSTGAAHRAEILTLLARLDPATLLRPEPDAPADRAEASS